MLLFQHRWKKLFYFQKVEEGIGGRTKLIFSLLIPKGRYSEYSERSAKRIKNKISNYDNEPCKCIVKYLSSRIYCSRANFATVCCLIHAQSPVKHMPKAPPQMSEQALITPLNTPHKKLSTAQNQSYLCKMLHFRSQTKL